MWTQKGTYTDVLPSWLCGDKRTRQRPALLSGGSMGDSTGGIRKSRKSQRISWPLGTRCKSKGASGRAHQVSCAHKAPRAHITRLGKRETERQRPQREESQPHKCHADDIGSRTAAPSEERQPKHLDDPSLGHQLGSVFSVSHGNRRCKEMEMKSHSQANIPHICSSLTIIEIRNSPKESGITYKTSGKQPLAGV